MELQTQDKKIMKELIIERLTDVTSIIRNIKKDGGFCWGTLNEYEKERKELVKVLRKVL